MNKWISLILRMTVFTASIIFLINKVDFIYLFNNILTKIPIWILILAILLSLFGIWLNGIRWKASNTDNTFQISNWNYFHYMMVSTSFNLVMPGALGGDVIKAAWVGTDLKVNRARNVLSIFFDRLIGMFSILILGLLSFLFSPLILINIKIIVWFSVAFLIVIFILLVWYIKKESFSVLINRWKSKKKIFFSIKKVIIIFQDIIRVYIKRPKIILYTLSLSFIMHFSLFIINYTIAQFLDIKISFLDISLVTCMVWLITAIPISISGIGIREISFISILGYYGVSVEVATGLSLYGFLIRLIIGLVALPFVLMTKRKR